jgi:beta-carotene 3-hydroxylase
MLFNFIIVVGTFFFMECVAWFTHKYIMHGFLWSWHKSHHKKHNHFLEFNDLFAVVFSIPSIASNVGGTSEAVLNNKTGIITQV